MKEKIHPNYGPCVIQCACGNVIETRGTKPRITVDVCSSCHPFFTGKQKLVDTAGRIDRFQKKYAGKITVGKAPQKKKKAPVPPPAPVPTPAPALTPAPPAASEKPLRASPPKA